MKDLTAALVAFVEQEVCGGTLELAPDTDLLLTGAVDSLGVIRITQWIEDETGVEVDPGDVTLDNFQTIERMVVYVEKRLAEH